jgi:hypothetical protein
MIHSAVEEEVADFMVEWKESHTAGIDYIIFDDEEMEATEEVV